MGRRVLVHCVDSVHCSLLDSVTMGRRLLIQYTVVYRSVLQWEEGC